MNIIERVKAVLLRPKETFELIKTESATSQGLILNYLAILAIIPAVASIIGMSAVGISVPFMRVFRFPLLNSASRAIVQYVLTLVGVYVLGLIINALAPTFSGAKNNIQALKIAVYCATPTLVAGILYIVPALGVLVIIAGLYGLYLLYLAIPIMMECPREKALVYTIAVIVANIVISVMIGAIAGAATATRFGFRLL
ncbi:MAG: Yip1 family protein [Candidatus Hydrothermarchaeota archaeon]